MKLIDASWQGGPDCYLPLLLLLVLPLTYLLQAKLQQVRAVFARHNLLNDFDYW